jgi:hypothetical protein
MGFAICTASCSKANSYARAVSYTKLDMDINSMMSSKGLREVMCFDLKFYFHPIDRAKSCNFGFSPFHPSKILQRMRAYKAAQIPHSET